jgi:hypothetical protein
VRGAGGGRSAADGGPTREDQGKLEYSRALRQLEDARAGLLHAIDALAVDQVDPGSWSVEALRADQEKARLPLAHSAAAILGEPPPPARPR